LNLNQNTYKINVKRILELENMKSNRNFYKMNANNVDETKEKNKNKKLELFKEVSNRFKNKMSSPTKLFKNNAFYKAGPDPLSKDQVFSNFVDKPNELYNIQLPKPKYSETPLVPIIEDCVETLCVPIDNNLSFTTPSQRIGSN